MQRDFLTRLKTKIQRKLGMEPVRINSIHIDKDKICQYLPKSPVVIDCGAHIGLDSIQFAKLEGSKVYAFEPVSHVYEKLVANTKDFQNIKCFNLALNNFDGEAEMYISSGDSDGSSSLLKPKKHLEDHPEVYFEEKEKVKCKLLDTWANENNVSRVDMLWLDMQGAEKSMLIESGKILDTVQVIHTEVTQHESYEGVGVYNELKKFLKSKGFVVKIEAIPFSHYGGNVLFVRKK